MSVQELYEQSIKPLPAADRFRLATMILGDIKPQSIVDDGTEWTEEDLNDLRKATWKRLESDPELAYDA